MDTDSGRKSKPWGCSFRVRPGCPPPEPSRQWPDLGPAGSAPLTLCVCIWKAVRLPRSLSTTHLGSEFCVYFLLTGRSHVQKRQRQSFPAKALTFYLQTLSPTRSDTGWEGARSPTVWRWTLLPEHYVYSDSKIMPTQERKWNHRRAKEKTEKRKGQHSKDPTC